MKEFLSALAGGVFALLGSYFASRWQSKHQRSNLLHEARINLYVDLIAECRRREEWLDALCDSYQVMQRLGKGYEPAVPLNARIELLALKDTRTAWETLEPAHERLRLAVNESGFPTHEEDFLLPRMPEVVALRQRLAGLRDAIHQDLLEG
ncbi:hypothetical protein [Micromonospora sp. NPDC049204]|uniref:hypothetical protein n=1 Tax=Micromonospora sp. NPDC049204 TaxID=3154351 RepID=UPI003408A21E